MSFTPTTGLKRRWASPLQRVQPPNQVGDPLAWHSCSRKLQWPDHRRQIVKLVDDTQLVAPPRQGSDKALK
jgi:hypothetical protein